MTDESESDSTQSRSERLRQRRSQRSETQLDATDGDTDDNSTDTGSTFPSGPASTEGDDPSPTDGTVKDEQVGTYMYIPETQKKEIQRRYNVLKAEYEYEFETSFEKNRHFYPLLIQYGLDSLEDLDAMDIQDHLDSL